MPWKSVAPGLIGVIDVMVDTEQIRDRKAEMEDKYLTVVEEHVDRLGEMAKNIQEELQVQDRMVDDLGNRIDRAQEHVANVNTRMKVSSDICRQLVIDRGLWNNAPIQGSAFYEELQTRNSIIQST